MVSYSSGQRGQTVNLLFLTSQVRILLSPQFSFCIFYIFMNSISTLIYQLNARVAQLVERQPSKLNVAGSNPVSRSLFLLPM